jgi:hypothetical protein
MHKHAVDRDDWRRADRFDPSVLMTIVIGIVVAAAIASLT